MKRMILSLILSAALAAGALAPAFAGTEREMAAEDYETLAHWVFSDEAGYSAGSLTDNSLKILDQSGRRNDLLLMTQKMPAGQNADESLSFSANVLRGASGPIGTSLRSLKFSPVSGRGAYFATAPGELDEEEFMSGYTFEIIFSARDSGQWAGVIGKRGTPNSAYDIRTDWHAEMDGSSQGSFNIGGSNDYTNAEVTGDLQLTFNNTNVKTHNPLTLNNNYQSCIWSDSYGITRDRLHYAVIRNDGVATVLYIDGLPVLRSDNHNIPQPGIDKLDGLGWVIGANYGYLKGAYFNGVNNWGQTTDNLLSREEFLALERAGSLGEPQFKGEIQEIRLTKGFRPDSGLLIPNNAGVVPDRVYTDKLGNNDDVEFLARPENYNFVFVPDTQYYVQYKRDVDGGSLILNSMLKWVGDNRKKYNIFGLSHLGDITENNSSPRSDVEWAAASKSFEILDEARMPYTVLPGNHDWRPNFLAAFPESRNKDKGVEFATSATPAVDPTNGLTRVGGGYSSYMIVRGGSYDYLVLSAGGPNSGSSNIGGVSGAQGDELNWCLAVLRAHKDLPTIVMEHSSGNTVVNNLINPFPQVFMHVWGHLSGSYAQWAVPGAAYANPGYWNIQIDYQSDVYGGNGWLDVFEFDEAAGTITARTFSPWAARKLKESATGSSWWKSLPRQDQAVYPFDVKNLTRYLEDSSVLTGYKNTVSGGSGLVTGNKPGGAGAGVLPLDFDSRFEGLAKAAPRLSVELETGTVKKGDYFDAAVSFDQIVASNAAGIVLNFDGTKFVYKGFEPAEGVTLLTEDGEDGAAALTLMVADGKTKSYGKARFQAKEDAAFADDASRLEVVVHYVLRGNDGDKSIIAVTAEGSILTDSGEGPNLEAPTLIDLSDIIDMFGRDSESPEWNSRYKRYDCNGDGRIDILDIVYVARRL